MDDTAVIEVDPEMFELPESTDLDALKHFMEDIKQHDKRGVKTLVHHIGEFLKLHRRALVHYEKAQRNLQTVNNMPSENQLQGHAKIKARKRAQGFFSGLNTKQLKEQCKVFGVSAQYLETDEEMKNALIERYVELQEGEE